MSRILVTGATGRVGREVLSQLRPTGVPVRALVRDPHSTALPTHIEAVRGDLTIPGTLDQCLSGIDTVFLVWTAPPAAIAPALERIVRQAHRIVFLSSPHNTAHPFFQAAQPNPISSMHAEIERLIESSGRSWTFLRPGMFAANALNWWAPPIRAGARIVRWPCAAAQTAPIHERDIAAVAVRALCGEGHDGAEYVLTGPESMTQAGQIAIIGRVIGRDLQMEELSGEEARRELFALIPDMQIVDMLLAAWSGAMGQPALMTDTVAEITGYPPRTFRDWVTENAPAFQSSPHS